MLILGGGVVGTNAALIAVGMGADVTVVDRNPERCAGSPRSSAAALRTVFSTAETVETLCRRADLVIGAVLVPGRRRAEARSSAETVKAMKPGAVIVDVSIDQGGCAETSRPTTHSHPTYVVDDVVHYCVANMPGAVARTSTFAINNVTLPFVLALADKGARRRSPTMRICAPASTSMPGAITYAAVAEALGQEYRPAAEALGL